MAAEGTTGDVTALAINTARQALSLLPPVLALLFKIRNQCPEKQTPSSPPPG